MFRTLATSQQVLLHNTGPGPDPDPDSDPDFHPDAFERAWPTAEFLCLQIPLRLIEKCGSAPPVKYVVRHVNGVRKIQHVLLQEPWDVQNLKLVPAAGDGSNKV